MAALIRLADPHLGVDELLYVSDALVNDELSWRGGYVARFERELTQFLGYPTLTTSSGMGALLVALHSLGIGPGDEVIVPALTFPGTASAVMAVGATPVLCDVSRETWGLDYWAARRALTRHTKAIIPVHLYGLDAGDFSEVGLPVIEDACEAFGIVRPRCQPYTVYSFYANKVITTGEGGAICGVDLSWAAQWRNGGFDSQYCCGLPGLNYRMGNLQAAVGCGQMAQVKTLLELRAGNADYYAQELPGKGWWLFCAEVPNPKAAMAALVAEGIESRPIFMPLHLQPAFRQEFHQGQFPVAEDIWKRHICLPTGPHLTEGDLKRICNVIKGVQNGDHDVQRVTRRSRFVASPE